MPKKRTSVDEQAAKHGYRIEEWSMKVGKDGRWSGYRLIGGKRVFGERVRKYAKSKKELHKEAQRLIENFQGRVDKALQLTASQRVDVGKAYELLEESGHDVDLAEVVRFFVKYNPAEQKCTNREAIIRFLESKGVSEAEFKNTDRGFRREKERRARIFKDHTIRHRTSLASLLRRFVSDWGEEQIGIMAAKRSALKDWLDGKFTNGTTRNNYRRALRNFYGWAVEKGLLVENPALPWKQSKTSAARARASAHPGILSPKEMQIYLKGAAESMPALLPYFAVCGFSGIRTDEIDRLRWKNIKSANIDIESTVSKTGVRRTIPIHPTLKAWLAVIPRGREEDRVVPPSFQAMRRNLRKTLNSALKIKLPWPANALRHSFGTYRFRETSSLEKTSDEMGHQDPKVFRRHYLNLNVTPDMANEYWSLMPAKVLLPAKLPGKKTGRKRRR